ncbi:MAG TPA: glycosyltransferase family 4 protein, partial [Ktedonobacterales bacterium]|nr:glycosyltransferase family 4 protein [Ktedonobacterales bacterium]
ATYATYMAYVISRFTGIGYSFTAHAHDIYMDQTMLAEKVRKADLVVPISEFNRRLLVSLCPEASAKIRVVYCGVDTETFHPVERPANDPGSPAGPLKIVAVARMQEYKGIRYLVTACRLLRDRGIEFHSTLIGDGPERREIEQAILHKGLRDVLDCVGWLPSSEVAAYIAQADVVVLPSVVARDGMMDGLPNVLMEALSCSVPVVSTTISGIPELVDSGRNGLLVPPADPDALADALAELAGDPARRRLMGEEGRKRVLATFDLINNTQQKARLLDNVVHRTLA